MSEELSSGGSDSGGGLGWVLVQGVGFVQGGGESVQRGSGQMGANGENGGVRGSGCKVAKKQMLKGRN